MGKESKKKNNLKNRSLKIYFILSVNLIFKLLKGSMRHILRTAGYKVCKKGSQKEIIRECVGAKKLRVQIGCGEKLQNDYIGCDAIDFPDASIICKPWELSKYCNQAQKIFSKNYIHYYTYPEVRTALSDWYRALKNGGVLHLIIPDMDNKIKKWLEADWTDHALLSNPEELKYIQGLIYGYPPESKKLQKKSTDKYYWIYKSGYTKKLIKIYAQEAGFSDIKIDTSIDFNIELFGVKKIVGIIPLFKEKLHSLYFFIKRFKYRIERIKDSDFIPASPNKRYKRIKLYVGCGEDSRPGFLGCDNIPLDNVDIVSDAWSISNHCEQVKEIFSKHMIERLTYLEIEKTLTDWHKALAINGKLHVIVPNIDFHIKQWQCAKWDSKALKDFWSDENWSMAGFYGRQNECDPHSFGKELKYWDVHKSCYNSSLLSFLLRREGFQNVTVNIKDEAHLEAFATKRIEKREKQVTPFIEHIRMDHSARYHFAADRIPNGATVLDIACGVGFGANIISKKIHANKIIAIDVDEQAIEYARKYYRGENITFLAKDILKIDWPEAFYDVVVSFETIEHLHDDTYFLNVIYKSLKDNGLFICSTPNQNIIPFNPLKYPYHVRHYSPDEFQDKILSTGFIIEEKNTQFDENTMKIETGWGGKFNIVVCRKGKRCI